MAGACLVVVGWGDVCEPVGVSALTIDGTGFCAAVSSEPWLAVTIAAIAPPATTSVAIAAAIHAVRRPRLGRFALDAAARSAVNRSPKIALEPPPGPWGVRIPPCGPDGVAPGWNCVAEPGCHAEAGCGAHCRVGSN